MSVEASSIREGRVAQVVREEFPGLRLRYCVVEATTGRSPAGVKRRLRYLSDRLHGRRALNLRREPIASAYRVFFRHIGLDPDESRVPIEAAVLERLRKGGFASTGLVDDAVTIGIVETGVALRALDAESIRGGLQLRVSQPDERLGGDRDGFELPEGTLVLADDAAALALIFGEAAPRVEVEGNKGRVAICALQVQGVPDISVEEALWISAELVTSSS